MGRSLVCGRGARAAVTVDVVALLALGTSGLSAALYLLAWWRAPREEGELLAHEPQPLRDTVVVVIPARNEVDDLPATLDALLANAADPVEVFVFDDDSDDGTADVVRLRAADDKRLHLLQPADVPADLQQPDDVFGKPWAQHRALHAVWQRRQRRDEPLLLLDADVVVEPGALGGALHLLNDHSLAAVSGSPKMVCQSAIEETLVPAFVSLVAVSHPPRRVNDPDDDDVFLNGQFILVRGAALDDVGGFSQVWHTILEDVALARVLHAAGHPVAMADLRRAASTRMYTSWPEIRDGFGKNAVDVHGGVGRTLRLAALSLALSWLPWTSLATVWATAPSTWSAACATLLFAATLAAQGSVRRRLGHTALTAAVLPAVYVAVAWVLAGAAVNRWRKGSVQWKGRTYQA